jgi:hypothetical protein
MTDEQDHMAVRALDFVRPAGELRQGGFGDEFEVNSVIGPSFSRATHVVVETKPGALGPLAGAVFVPGPKQLLADLRDFGQQQANAAQQQIGQQQAASNQMSAETFVPRPTNPATLTRYDISTDELVPVTQEWVHMAERRMLDQFREIERLRVLVRKT